MSKQLQDFAKEQMEFKLKVRYDREPTTLIATAEKIADDLRVKAKDATGVRFKTKGKAWVIEQLELNDQEMMSTVIQQTTAKCWVSFEVVHQKDVQLSKIFVEELRAKHDIRLMLLPTVLISVILFIIEILVLWETLVKKEVIILTKYDWWIIAITTIAIIGWFAFVFYKIRNQRLQLAYFEINAKYTSVKVYVFYFKAKTKAGKEIVFKYTLTVQCMRGKYFHPDNPRKKARRKLKPKTVHCDGCDATVVLTGKPLEDLDTIEKLQERIKLANDSLIVLMEKEYQVYKALDSTQKEIRQYELDDLSREHAVTQNMVAKNDSGATQKEEVAVIEATVQKKILVKSRVLISKETSADELETKLEALKNKISGKKREIESQRSSLQSQLTAAIEGIYDIDEQTDDEEEEIFDLVNAHQLSLKYRSKNADLTNRISNLMQTISGLYDTLHQLDKSSNQRIAEEVARQTNTNYGYEITAGSQLEVAAEQQQGQPTRSRNRSGAGDILPMIIRLSVVAIIFIGGIGATVFGIIKIVEYFALIHPVLAFLIIVGMILLVFMLIWVANYVINKLTATDSTTRLR